LRTVQSEGHCDPLQFNGTEKMPMRTARACSAVFLLVLAITACLLAQERASVVWNCTKTDSTHVSAVEGPVTGFPVAGKNLIIRDYTGVLSGGGGGPLGPFQRWYTNANWPDENVENTDRYIQIAAGPKAGYTLNLSSIVFILCAKSTSGMKADLTFSTHSMFSASSPINAAGVSFDSAACGGRVV